MTPDLCIDHGPLAALCLACLEKNIGQRVEAALKKERDRIKKIHEEHRGMDWGMNEERFWKEVEGA